MVDVPEWLMVGRWDPNGNTAFVTWDIVQPDGHGVIELDFSIVNDREYKVRRELLIYGKEPPFSIPVFLGDADAGYTIVFTRVE